MLQITLEAEDRFSLYTGVGSNDVPMPQRTISTTDFPSAPASSSGKPVPIIYGDPTPAISGTSATPPPTWNWDYPKGFFPGLPDIDPFGDDGRRLGVSRTGYGAMTGNLNPPTNVYCSLSGGGDVDTGKIVWINCLLFSVATIDLDGDFSDPGTHHATLGDSAHGADGFQTNSSGGSNWASPYVPYYCHYIEWAADDQTLTFNWAWPGAATTGWKVRVSVAWQYYGTRWHFYKEVAYPATSTTMTDYPGAWPDRTTEAPTGWTYYLSGIGGDQFHISALMADGETLLSRGVALSGGPYPRPMYVRWNAVTGALGYRLYKTPWSDNKSLDPAGLTMTGYWEFGSGTTSATITDYMLGTDTSNKISSTATVPGTVPTTYVGMLKDLNGVERNAFLVCGHAVKAITAVYQNGRAIASGAYGTAFWVPGQTGFTAAYGTTYRDIGGRRYTLIYVSGSSADLAISGEQPISVIVKGIENVGDGTGTVITAIHDQYAHWLEHWVLRNYQTGNWATVPTTWGDQPYDVAVIDTSTFAVAKTVCEARLTGGYTGYVAIGADGAATVRTWIARWNLSADCYSGFDRKSQYVIKVIDSDPTNADDAPVFTADAGIVADSFRIDDDVSAIENRITAVYSRNWNETTTSFQSGSGPVSFTAGNWQSSLTAEDVDVQETIGEVKPYTLELWAVTTTSQAWDIANRRLQRRKYPYRYVTWTCDMGGLTLDLGDIVKVSHPDGVGATGWTERPCFVIRHEFDPTNFTITITAVDLEFAYTPSLSVAESVTLSAWQDEVWIGARTMLGA